MNSANSNNNYEKFLPQNQIYSPISQITNLKINQKTTIETNFCLQIIGIKKLDKKPSIQDSNNKNSNMYLLNLSDNYFSYNGFIVCDKNALDLHALDIIEVFSILVLPTEKQQKLLLIKNYNLVGKADKILGNPQHIAKLVSNEDFGDQEKIGILKLRLL